MARVDMPGEVLSMSGAAADGLLRLGQGDAALLYLALLRRGGDLGLAGASLGWSQGRLETAYAALKGLSLVGPAPVTGERAAEAAPPPEYGAEDVVSAVDGDPAFAALQRQMERLLGTVLTPADLKQLYLIYDYLALPSEVILELGAWCVDEMERKYGPGRRPRMSQIKKTAFRWREWGIDTLQEAEAYLKRQSGLNQRERELLPKLGVRDRLPRDREREYIATWVDWGFPDETIVLAYDKTVMKKQSMSWAYMNSILRSWHEKGFHTVGDVKAGEGGRKTPPPRGATPVPSGGRVAQDLADLKKAARKEG